MIKHCNRFPRKFMESLSLQIWKTQLAMVLGNLLQLALLCGTGRSPEVPPASAVL